MAQFNTERPKQRHTFNIHNRTIRDYSKQSLTTHRDRNSQIYFHEPKQESLSFISRTNQNPIQFRRKTECKQNIRMENDFQGKWKKDGTWNKVNIFKDLKQVLTINRKRNRFFKNYFNQKQEPEINFSNILLSNRVKHNQIENQTKISKIYKLNQKQNTIFINIQINGQKAPKKQIIDHFKMKKSQSNPNFIKIQKMRKNQPLIFFDD